MTKKTVKNIVILVVIALIVVYSFYVIIEKNGSGKSDSKTKSDVEKLADRNLDEDYPDTPKGVVDYYSQIITCLYEGGYSEDEMKELAKQAHKLMDDELASRNEFDDYYKNLRDDVESYKADEKKISSYLIESGDDVKYKDFQERKYSFVDCIYYTKGKEGTAKVPEEYTLRMDKDGKWKILYWKMVNKNEK